MRQWTGQFIGEFQRLRKGDGDLVVVEGVHAVKHAWRFGAEFEVVVTADKLALLELVAQIATEAEVGFLAEFVQEISELEFAQLSPHLVRTGVVALVKKPSVVDLSQIAQNEKPIVFVQNPRDLGNVGAVMRVSAGFGVACVMVSGTANPWHAEAIRGGAGLQFAQSIAQISDEEMVQFAQKSGRLIIACDGDGENMYEAQIACQKGRRAQNAILVFGTERGGITPEMKAAADQIISIPMQPKVSSLNLATSVSAVLYGACSAHLRKL